VWARVRAKPGYAACTVTAHRPPPYTKKPSKHAYRVGIIVKVLFTTTTTTTTTTIIIIIITYISYILFYLINLYYNYLTYIYIIYYNINYLYLN
jgi:preprotein translocase subunit SecE